MAYSAHDLADTIVALATPPGVGAIGVIRVSGPEAIKIVDGVFHGKDLARQPGHTAHFGTIRDGERILDEVLATVFVAPRSYTGEHTVEVSCHGSDYILQEVIRLFLRRGARPARPGEFTLRAFLHGRMDLSQAEAVADLIASSSAGNHELALRQMRGGFSHEIQELRQQLIDFASLIELELDFGEEDVEFANRDDLRQLVHRIQEVLRQLIESFRLGNVIKQGVTTVLAGRPNAGKSTLLNALLNEERAIVSEVAGTTRDTIEEVLNIKGIQFRLVDTAGIREAEDTIEAMGVKKTLERVRQSSLLVYVFDVVATSPEEVRADLEKLLLPGMQVLVVANKMDLNPYTTYEQYFGSSDQPPAPSSREGEFPPLEKWRTANPHAYHRLKDYARELRKNQTPAESALWQRLRKRQVSGVKFLRQHIIGQFIADFYCPEKKLIIEVDGGYHQLPEVKVSDEQRTAILTAGGYQVIRFRNEEVFEQIDAVLTKIQQEVEHSPPSLERGVGGGSKVGGVAWVPIIAKEGMNIPYLKDKLYAAAVSDKVGMDQTIVSNARHYEALEKAQQALDDVLKGMDTGITSDFVAMDIRRALHHLGSITGEISTDDLLGNIFGRFCIGK